MNGEPGTTDRPSGDERIDVIFAYVDGGIVKVAQDGFLLNTSASALRRIVGSSGLELLSFSGGAAGLRARANKQNNQDIIRSYERSAVPLDFGSVKRQLDQANLEVAMIYIKAVAEALSSMAGVMKAKPPTISTLGRGRVRRLGKVAQCFVAGTLVATPSMDVAIESLHVGDSVSTLPSLTEGHCLSQVPTEDSDWRIATLAIAPETEIRSDISVELLRPRSWFEARELDRIGASLAFHLPEMGIRGQASILEIRPTNVKRGLGCIVLAKVSSLSNDVYEVGFGEGVAPLRGTGLHPLYSLDRDDWVQVRDLRIGERLQTAEGGISIVALEKVRGLHRVFNLEVEGDHEFLVGDAQIRAHNNKVKPEKATVGAQRRVGDFLESVDDIMANPKLLKGLNPADVQKKLSGKIPGDWAVTSLQKGTHKGQGWVLREMGRKNEPTGKMIRWHPGGGRHGPNPYWHVNSGHGQADIIPGVSWPR